MKYDYGLIIYIGRRLEAETYPEATNKAADEASRIEKVFGENVKVTVDYVKSAKEEKDGADVI